MEKAKLLLIEECPELRKVISLMIGCVFPSLEVFSTEEPEKAYTFVKKEFVGIAIVGCTEEKKKSVEIIKRLKTQEPELPLIIMSGDIESFRETLGEERRRGVINPQDYPCLVLRKPFDMSELSWAINAVFQAKFDNTQ
ncbi:MAG TPA: hypothetical protein PLK35_03395 [Candidatus Moranbacteria bacterium]|nr:hypothetical protein [Candidatus Moranbacteria bacterium]